MTPFFILPFASSRSWFLGTNVFAFSLRQGIDKTLNCHAMHLSPNIPPKPFLRIALVTARPFFSDLAGGL